MAKLKLPRFPEFKEIELGDKEPVEAMTAAFSPYADFNFTELWCWNQGPSGGISDLHGNLVICWEDVVSGEPFITFLGHGRVTRTAEELIEYARSSGIDDQLHAIPEDVIRQIDGRGTNLLIADDATNSDYLLSTEEWSSIAGARFKNKRNAIHRLERKHDPDIRLLDLADERTGVSMIELFRLWADLRHRDERETQSEFVAIRNLLKLAIAGAHERIYAIGAFVGDSMIGFSVNELLRDGYAIGHFAKADVRYEGVYPYMLRNVAQYMRANGVRLLNIEADLGDPGLATAKRLCHPVAMLRKYSIAPAPSIHSVDGYRSDFEPAALHVPVEVPRRA